MKKIALSEPGFSEKADSGREGGPETGDKKLKLNRLIKFEPQRLLMSLPPELSVCEGRFFGAKKSSPRTPSRPSSRPGEDRYEILIYSALIKTAFPGVKKAFFIQFQIASSPVIEKPRKIIPSSVGKRDVPDSAPRAIERFPAPGALPSDASPPDRLL